MARFLDVVKYRGVALCCTKDIVECCFIVQNSLSYLNLELCESCVFHELGNTTLSYHYKRQYDHGFVSTEEKCRKKFDSNRHFMYKLHLDIPKARNVCLRHGPNPDDLIPGLEQFPVGKLSICKDFYPFILSSFIEYIFEYADDELRVTECLLRQTKWFLRLDAVKEFEFGGLSPEFTNYFIDLLYPKFIDTELMKQFLLKCNLGDWIEAYEKPDVLENLLYHAHRYGRRRIETYESHDHALPNLCIFQQVFLNIGPLLKFRHGPSFCSSIYRLYMDVIEHYCKNMNLTTEVLSKPESWMSIQRYCLLLQVILIYIIHESDALNASEALRLLWSTYPDSYITLQEIQRAFGEVYHTELINKIYEFYSKSVGEIEEPVQPRPLKHYCRVNIRKTLWRNQNWLPEGIAGTGLPGPLQAFLNLEKGTKCKFATVRDNEELLIDEK